MQITWRKKIVFNINNKIVFATIHVIFSIQQSSKNLSQITDKFRPSWLLERSSVYHDSLGMTHQEMRQYNIQYNHMVSHEYHSAI